MIPRPARTSLPALACQVYDVPAQSRCPPALKVSLIHGPAPLLFLYPNRGHSALRWTCISVLPLRDLWSFSSDSKGPITTQKLALCPGNPDMPRRILLLFEFWIFKNFLLLICNTLYPCLYTHWRKDWQPTPVFWPGESHGQEKPRQLQSIWSQRVGHNWVTNTTIYK